MMDEYALNIYTDGSSRKNPRRGGIGVRYVHADPINGEEVHIDSDYPGYLGATNNEMELLACIQGLEDAKSHPAYSNFEKMILITDSQYVRDNLNNAKFTWPKNHWFRANGQPVLNVDLWKQLVKFIKN
ncbi:MAG: ribonuclease HI, partial [Gammaproteobacteria bacterium]|nr:ribonuclease HI [Gammaproteobacteria bacterium]